MKKQIFKRAAIFAILIFFSQTHSFAQGPTRIAQKSDVWYAFYTVTIKGHGTKEPEVGSGDDEITWSVERIYSGNVKLSDGVRVADTRWSDEERKESIWTERKIRFKDLSPQVHIQIKDYIRKKSDPTCEEYTSTIETWTADVRGTAPKGDEAWLSIDNKTATYDVLFPVMYQQKGLDFALKHEKDIFYFPKQTTKPITRETVSLADHRIPDIQDWLEKNGEITRFNEAYIKKDGSVSLKSKKIVIQESLLREVNTSGEVEAEIEWVIKKEGD